MWWVFCYIERVKEIKNKNEKRKNHLYKRFFSIKTVKKHIAYIRKFNARIRNYTICNIELRQQTFKPTKKDKLKLSETKIKFRYSRSHAMLCDIDFCTCVSVSVYIFHPCSFLSSECCSCKYFFCLLLLGLPLFTVSFVDLLLRSFTQYIHLCVLDYTIHFLRFFSSSFNVLFCLAHFIRWWFLTTDE